MLVVGSVLIVDDHEDFRMILSAALSDFCLVQTAPSVKTALEMLTKYRFDLLILDISLTDGEGFDIAKSVNAQAGYAPSIVFMTGYSEKNAREMSWKHMAEDFVTKPFNIHDFSNKIRNKLKNIQVLRERYKSVHEVEEGTFSLSLIGCDAEGKKAKELQFLDDLIRQFSIGCSDTELGVDAVAKEMGLSRRCFQRYLANATGESFSTLLRRFRTRSAEVLLNQDYSVKEVSLMCGFSSASYFSTSFKREFGHSPREHRQNLAEA
ncbi:helix-turn-helix domain-containing protein [Planktotalea sp.]|uniref:helix-turn-helix domain-containing protein n=1 Tax=Planktotalea sp. TaxID=2029877 RepID=UPI003D6A2908